MKTGLTTDAAHQSHEPAPAPPRDAPATDVATLDRHFWLMLLIAALIILPRSAMIARAHNECMDANFHMKLGFRFMTGNPGDLIIAATDPPLGQVIMLLPLAATGCYPSAPVYAENWPAGRDLPGATLPGEPPKSDRQQFLERTLRRAPLYGNRLSPETLLLMIGLWKAMLFLPCVAVAFHWCRQLYGLQSAWLAAALLTIDPTIAGNIPTVALDSLGVTSIVFACYCIWRYFETGQTRGRLIVTAVAIAAAMLIKHTAVILPGVFLLYALYLWGWREWRSDDVSSREQWLAKLRPRFNTILLLALLVFVAMWVLLGFDYSTPMTQCSGMIDSSDAGAFAGRDLLLSILERKQINGTYIGCLVSGWRINRAGQAAMLFDRVRDGGWWYYFPVLATFKVPLGIAAVVLLGILSLIRSRLGRCEMSLLIPLLAWTAFLLASNMNYSFRHFLPAYVFILMWASRCLMPGMLGARGPLRVVAWLGIAVAAIDVSRFHPDYLSYVNFPRQRIEYQITDSNLDWGQGIRQIDGWLAAHPQHAGKPVRLLPRWDGAGLVVPYWTHGGVEQIYRGKPPPTDGLLIMSPVYVCGVYDAGFNPYAFLRKLEPIDWIGHSMPVYDLDTPAARAVLKELEP